MTTIFPHTHPVISYLIIWRETPILLPPSHFGIKDRPVPQSRNISLLDREAKFWVVHQYETYEITVPRMFMTDGTSKGRIADLILRETTSTVPSFFHDVGYYTRGFNLIPREAWDIYFRQAMSMLGQASWRLTMMHRGVRLFGGMAWAKRSPIDRWNEAHQVNPTIQAGNIRELDFRPTSDKIQWIKS